MIGCLGQQVQVMVKDVLDAYITRNVVQAEFECSCDSEVDTLHTSLFR